MKLDNNNNISFGRVFATIKPKSSFEDKCLKTCREFEKLLNKEKSMIIIDGRPYYTDRTFSQLCEYDFAVDCKKGGDVQQKTNEIAEKNLMNRFKNWAVENGLRATITRQNEHNIEETIKVPLDIKS